jgi:hypothetical protein
MKPAPPVTSTRFLSEYRIGWNSLVEALEVYMAQPAPGTLGLPGDVRKRA